MTLFINKIIINPKWLKLYLSTFLLIIFTVPQANVWAIQTNKSSFNLHITHTESKRLYDSATLQTRLTSATAYRSEQISEKLGGRILFGYQEQIQDKNSITAAQYAAGYFGGISLNYTVLKITAYQLKFFSQYQYHQLEGRDGIQKINIQWHDLTAGIRNYYTLTPRLQILADARYYQVVGSQRALEPLSQIINFKNKSSVTYSVGLAYQVDVRGYLAIKWIAGAQQGFRLFLAKDF